MIKNYFVFSLIILFLLPKIGFSEEKYPNWIHNYNKYAYGHWEWFKEIPFEDWVKNVKNKGADVIVVGQIPDKDNNYKWIGKFSSIAKKYNMRVLIYVNFKRVPIIQSIDKNYQAVNWNDKRVKQFGDICNYKYRNEIVELLTNLAKNYKFDGYIIDMFFSDVPYGSKSKECVYLFKKEYKYNTPPNKYDIINMTYKFIDWINFHSNLRKKFLKNLTQKLHKINPNFALIVNQTRGWKFNIAYNQFLPIGLEDVVDGIMEEGNWEYKLRGQIPNRTIVKYIFQNKLLFSRKRGITLFWLLTYPQPIEEFKYKLINTLMHGNVPVFTTGSNLNIMNIMWREIEKNQKILLNKYTQSANPIAVVFSEKTLWHFNPIKEENTYLYIFNIYGFIQMLLEEYLPFDVISDYYLSNKDISKYKVIILPNTAILSKKEISKLINFIKNGGLVISSFETGMYDRHNIKISNGLYEKISNYHAVKEISFDKANWLYSKDLKEFLKDKNIEYYLDWRQGRISRLNYFPILPKIFKYKIKGFIGYERNGAYPIGRFIGHLKKEKTVNLPIFILKKIGKGFSIYFPYNIGNIYFQNNFPPISKLLFRIVTEFSDVKNYSLQKYYYIEINKFRNRNKYFDIIINHNILWGFGDSPNYYGYNYVRDIVNFRDLQFYKIGVEND